MVCQLSLFVSIIMRASVNFTPRLSYLGYDIYTWCAHHLVDVFGEWEGVPQDGIRQQIVTLASERTLFQWEKKAMNTSKSRKKNTLWR